MTSRDPALPSGRGAHSSTTSAALGEITVPNHGSDNQGAPHAHFRRARRERERRCGRGAAQVVRAHRRHRHAGRPGWRRRGTWRLGRAFDGIETARAADDARARNLAVFDRHLAPRRVPPGASCGLAEGRRPQGILRGASTGLRRATSSGRWSPDDRIAGAPRPGRLAPRRRGRRRRLGPADLGQRSRRTAVRRRRHAPGGHRRARVRPSRRPRRGGRGPGRASRARPWARRSSCGCGRPRGWRLVEIIGANLLDRAAVKGLVLCMRDLTERRRWEVASDEVGKFRSSCTTPPA